ncbi:MAG: hypothetical protein IPO88_19540 [Nannocystis sp.]|uniref:hypothetical protein n=1 Tax=Nannocystis sp. TaxID=1962667 RepID=UPI002425976F|nr:hypothetical protein [Nannocystis sp.]MBK9755662.1 hypothetical protein [Nannocystis sp.]
MLPSPACASSCPSAASALPPAKRRIQVGGLGQLENALLEAVVARQPRNASPQIASESPGDPKTSLSSLLDQLPVDEHARRVLFAHKPVSLLPPPKARPITPPGRRPQLHRQPRSRPTAPPASTYSFNGVRYSFADCELPGSSITPAR